MTTSGRRRDANFRESDEFSNALADLEFRLALQWF